MIFRALAFLTFLIVTAAPPNCCAHAAPSVDATTHAHDSQHGSHAASERDSGGHRPADDGSGHHPAGTAACVMALGLVASSASDLAAPSAEPAPTSRAFAHSVEELAQGPIAPPPKQVRRPASGRRLALR
jgi:hypothetical protein